MDWWTWKDWLWFWSWRKRFGGKKDWFGLELLECNSRPKKRSYSTSETDAQRKAYYLDKSTKNLPNKTLETIYEEFDDMNVTTTLMSSRKFRRLIDFKNKTAAPAKINKRALKIKRIFGSKSHLQSKHSKVSMQALVKKLDSILARPPSAES